MRIRPIGDPRGQDFQLLPGPAGIRLCLERAGPRSLAEPFEDELDQQIRLERHAHLQPFDLVVHTVQPAKDRRIRALFRRREEQGQRLIDQRAHMDAMIAGDPSQLAQIGVGDPDMQTGIAGHGQSSRPSCFWTRA